MHTALAMYQSDEFDRSIAISLALLFNERSHPFGKGLILELFDGCLSRKDEKRVIVQPQKVCDVVAYIAVTQFPPNHARTLFNSTPPNRKLEIVGSVLAHGLIDEDSGWIRVARDELDRLRSQDLRKATNRRIGEVCLEVVSTLKAHYGQDLPRGAVCSAAWQRALVWMIERLIEASYDGISTGQRVKPDETLLVPAEFLAEALDHLPRSQVFTLDRACDMGLLDVGTFPTLAKIGANVRREHLAEHSRAVMENMKKKPKPPKFREQIDPEDYEEYDRLPKM